MSKSDLMTLARAYAVKAGKKPQKKQSIGDEQPAFGDAPPFRVVTFGSGAKAINVRLDNWAGAWTGEVLEGQWASSRRR